MRLAVIVLTTLLPTAALAQTSAKDLRTSPVAPPPGVWGVEWSASAEPTFQLSRDRLPDLTLEDVEDEGEYGFGVTVSREVGPTKLSFSPLATFNPNLFDDDDEASGWSVAARLQRSIPVSAFTAPNGRKRERQDTVLPFVDYRLGRSYEGVFEKGDGEERTLEAGVVFTDIRSYLCGADETRGQGAGCTGLGLRYTITPSFVDVDAEKDDDDRTGPKLAIKLQRPLLATSSLWVQASAERRSYESRLSDDGDAAEADRFVVGAGVDVSAWARRTLNLSDSIEVGIGVRWVKVDANRADMVREDFALLPTISWTR